MQVCDLVLLSIVILGNTFLPVSSEIFFKNGSPHVKLNDESVISGSIKYSREGRPYSSFQGIQYATVPGRFEPSQISTPSWKGIKSFNEPGDVCMQRYFDGSSRGAEQCLSANIYVPMNNTGDRHGYPVMLYIHGGGFMLGSGFGNGEKFLMDEDVIVINFNYRLGVFGFLSLDSLVPGNNAMKDMVNLLKWVQLHISKFGGNPHKVTIFGESAGAAAVHHLTLSPLAEGLFHRAISQSGSSIFLLATDPDPRGNAVQLATHLKCPTIAEDPSQISSEEILDCFKSVSAEELNQAQFEYKQSWPPLVRPFFFPPTPEPKGTPKAFLTEYPMKILADKRRPLRQVPWMVGATEDEGGTMYSGVVIENPDLLKQLNTEWDKVAPVAFDYDRYPFTSDQIQTISTKIRKFYFGSETDPIALETNRENLTNLFSDQLITHSVYKAAMETAARGNSKSPVYLYQYAYPGPVSVMAGIFGLKGPETKMACHADDLSILFDLGENLFPGSSNAIEKGSPDEEFSKNMVRLWVSFAVHGEPKHYWGAATESTSKEKIKWRPLSKKQVDGEYPVKWWRLDSNPGYITEPFKERMQFWDDLYEDYFTPFYQKAGSSVKAKTEL